MPQALDHIFKQLGSAAGSSSMVARVVVSAYEVRGAGTAAWRREFGGLVGLGLYWKARQLVSAASSILNVHGQGRQWLWPGASSSCIASQGGEQAARPTGMAGKPRQANLNKCNLWGAVLALSHVLLPPHHIHAALQIYNEVVYDLLALARAPAGAAGAAAAAARPALKLKEMKGCHIAVQGAAEVRALGGCRVL